MLSDLLNDVRLAAGDKLLGRVLRWLDRSRLIMTEQDARAETAARGQQEDQHASGSEPLGKDRAS
jgi:hypothetical protein